MGNMSNFEILNKTPVVFCTKLEGVVKVHF